MKRSNHPPTKIKSLPASISRRLTDISNDEQAFSDASPLYANALKESGYSEGLQYLAHRKTEVKDSKRKRQRKVIWFNPPYSRNIKTNVGYNFLRLVDERFPKGSTLHKIFNRNNLKVSYSCMQNVATIISQHNNKVRRNQQQDRSDRGETRKCNCRIKDQCPLEGECLTDNVVDKAVVTSGNDRKIYTGLTANSFKQRYYNHQQSMRHKEYETSTTLSKYIWTSKDANTEYNIEWKIHKRAAPYTCQSRRCNLCLAEKLAILQEDKGSSLNKRSELISKCRHENRFYLSNFLATVT